MLKSCEKLIRFGFDLLLFSSLSFTSTQAANQIAVRNALRLYVPNMGYGDATLIQLPSEKNILIDCGTYESGDRLLSFLHDKKVNYLELLVVTHPHDNHYGGLAKLAEAISIQQVITSDIQNIPDDLKQTYESLYSKHIPIQEVRAGEKIIIDSDTSLHILHPSQLAGEPNTDSLVLEIAFKHSVLLFTGDIPPDIQTHLIKSKLLVKQPNWTLLPHHGGKLSEIFATFIGNSVNVISTGPHETWKAPDQETIHRFTTNLFRTDLDGDLGFLIRDGEVAPLR